MADDGRTEQLVAVEEGTVSSQSGVVHRVRGFFGFGASSGSQDGRRRLFSRLVLLCAVLITVCALVFLGVVVSRSLGSPRNSPVDGEKPVPQPPFPDNPDDQKKPDKPETDTGDEEKPEDETGEGGTGGGKDQGEGGDDQKKPVTPTGAGNIRHGISWNPLLKDDSGPEKLRWDDVGTVGGAAWWASPPDGRADLDTARRLGAGSIRVYGLAPMDDHRPFLETVVNSGLSLFAGSSDFPLMQQPGSCLEKPEGCFGIMKGYFSGLLSDQTGFIADGKWHRAVSLYALVNEPDLKFKGGWARMAKLVVTVLDALLVVEKERGVTEGPKLTVPMSVATTAAYDPESLCHKQGKVSLEAAGVAQMCDLASVISDPSLVGYSPVSGEEAFRTVLEERMEFSFNAFFPPPTAASLVVEPYKQIDLLKDRPLHLTEWQNTGDVAGLPKALSALLDLLEPFQGRVFFFEFETAYWKGGSEMGFGMFSNGDQVVAQCRWPNCFGEQPVYCKRTVNFNDQPVGQAVAKAFGGEAPSASWPGFCPAEEGEQQTAVIA